MFKLDLEKEPEIKLPASVGSLKKQECSRKTDISVLLTMSNLCVERFDILWKILKEMDVLDHWPASWETYMQVRKQQLELDMEQTGSK